jgi:hypothetical protein
MVQSDLHIGGVRQMVVYSFMAVFGFGLTILLTTEDRRAIAGARAARYLTCYICQIGLMGCFVANKVIGL